MGTTTENEIHSNPIGVNGVREQSAFAAGVRNIDTASLDRPANLFATESEQHDLQQIDQEIRGTFCCPICMKDTPHGHDKRRWIGVDFDGTLAHDAFERKDPYELGEPIMPMVHRVKDWLAKGFEVRLMTARMCDYSHTTGLYRNVTEMERRLQEWCKTHLGVELVCTNVKDGLMEVLWDDRAVRVIKDAGQPAP